jgi:hypothetical protein
MGVNNSPVTRAVDVNKMVAYSFFAAALPSPELELAVDVVSDELSLEEDSDADLPSLFSGNFLPPEGDL